MGFPVPDTGSVTEDDDVGGVLTVSGDIDYRWFDDTGDWTAETITGAYGSQLVIDEDGNWTYTADNSNPAIQALDTGETLTEVFNVSSAGGASTVTITIHGVDEPPCFVAGTPIDTPQGPRPVESLRVGDRVLTRDHGEQVIRWTGARVLALDGPEDVAALFAPIRLRAGSLGPNVPACDLLVSPMHRVVIRHPLVALLTGSDEVLCPARLLLNGTTVMQDRVAEVSYHHLLFDRHEVLRSHGCDSESFYPGELGLDGFGAGTREEVLTLFPELRSLAHAYGPTARRVTKRHEALILADSLARAARPGDKAA